MYDCVLLAVSAGSGFVGPLPTHCSSGAITVYGSGNIFPPSGPESVDGSK